MRLPRRNHDRRRMERENRQREESPRRGGRPALSGAAESWRAAPFAEIIEDGSDCTVEAMFKYGARHWGVRYADISTDAPHTALWDILRQIPELR